MSLLDLKSKSILIVDDLQEIRSMIRSMVEPLSPKLLRVAKNGEEAIEKMREMPFDIVLCDYNLGNGQDGQQVLEEAKVHNLLSYTAIFIMVTAESQSPMVMAAIDYLPDAYLTKPLNRTLLHSRLQRVIAKKEGMVQITKAISEKNYDLALALCNEELEKNPRNTTNFLKTKGELLTLLGNYDAAAKLCESLLETYDIPWVKLELGRVRFLQEKYNEAEEILSEAIKDNPANITCYDWLAKTQDKKGDKKAAQESLIKAISVSPKSVVRQRYLAELANQNDDLETSQKAYQETLSNGRHSCFRDADDYTRLVSTFIKQKDNDKAAEVIIQLQKEFDKEDTNSNFQAAVAQALLCNVKDDAEGVKNATREAMQISSTNSEALSVESTLELTGICLASGDQEAAETLTRHLIRNNHDDEKLLTRTNQIYADAGLSESGNKLIEKARKEVIYINNEGTKLLREGKLEEALSVLLKANQSMPANAIVLVNLIYTLVKQIEKTGEPKKYLPLTLKHLNKLNTIDPTNKKYPMLMKLIHKLPKQKKLHQHETMSSE